MVYHRRCAGWPSSGLEIPSARCRRVGPGSNNESQIESGKKMRLVQVAVLVGGALAAAAACAKSDPPEECAALTDIGNSLNYNAWTKKVGNAWPPRHHVFWSSLTLQLMLAWHSWPAPSHPPRAVRVAVKQVLLRMERSGVQGWSRYRPVPAISEHQGHPSRVLGPPVCVDLPAAGRDASRLLPGL